MTIKTDGIYFKDEHGRTLLLRGVNLGGSSKVPYTPDGATHISDGFFNHRDVSFVGRPFPIEEADEHFARLKSWGLTFLRFIVTWEAIEHAGPGQYDIDYLDYISAIIDKAAEYNINMFIDPHQDVWSRFTGGDGAPGWTLEAVGFDMTKFKETGTALVHQTQGDPFPQMQWFTNYFKLAAATMFTLFFGGNDFAPKTKIDGEPAQDYLQRHYFAAMQEVAKRVKDKPNVVGYDTLNEPASGFIGYENAGELSWEINFGLMATPFQSMALGMGIAQTVGKWEFTPMGTQQVGTVTINPNGTTAWLEGHECIWKQNEVWDFDEKGVPILLRPHHFSVVEGETVNFERDYMKPFINKFAQAIREVDPDAIIFIEFGAVGENVAEMGADDAQNIVYAPHYYDGLTLITKRYTPWLGIGEERKPVLGHENARKATRETLSRQKALAESKLGGVPTLMGEIGIPYDMNKKQAYSTGDWSAQAGATDDYMQALEANLLHFTIWNYTADNSNMRGDLWNGEDLSIFSRDQQDNPSDINSGGRALNAVVRPYAIATAGEPLRMSFDIITGTFEFAFRHDDSITEPTEFYIPRLQYPDGYIVDVGDGKFEKDEAKQRLRYWASDKDIPHFIVVKPTIPREVPEQADNRAFIVVLVTLVVMYVLSKLGGGKKKKRGKKS